MEENNLQQSAEVVVEEDEKYQEILDKFENPTKTTVTKKKKKPLGVIVALVALVLLIGGITAMLLIPQTEEEAEETQVAGITVSADENQVWQSKVETDSKGNIKQNGTGTLIEYEPANIQEIKVKNEFGSYTLKSYTPVVTSTDPSTGEETTSTTTTEYTLIGYEDFDLQSGNPDAVATDCSIINFNKIISADATNNLADYGLDKPRSVVTVSYTDGKKSVIKVGADALQSLGVYISFGDSNAVYIVDSDAVDTLLNGVNSLMSLTISKNADSSENSEPKYIQLSGTAYDDKIHLVPSKYPDQVTDTYLLTSPVESYASNTEASAIAGAVRGLIASEVVYLNPTAKDLKRYGLADNYAHLVAKYSDTTINLIASQPDRDSLCYIMNKGGNMIYKISADTIPWVETNVSNLISDYILAADLGGLDSVTVVTDKEYKFTATTTVTETTNEDGETTELEETTVKYNGKQLNSGYFETYFDNLSLLAKAETDNKPKGKAKLTVTYDYTGDKKSDTVEFFESDNNRYVVKVNSKIVGEVYNTYAEKLIEQTSQVAENKQVESFW